MLVADVTVLGLPLITLLTRVLHILPAAFAIGVNLYLFFVLQPATKALTEEQHGQLKAGLRWRMAIWVHVAVTLLLLTGLYNFFMVSLPDTRGHAMPYHGIFGVKVLLALAVFTIQILLSGRSEAAKRFQARARMWVGLNVVLLVILVLLSSALSLLRQGYLRGSATPPVATQPAP